MQKAKSRCTTKMANHCNRRRRAVHSARTKISLNDLHEAVSEEIIKHVLPEKWLHADTKYHINPTGKFMIGGPVGDCGLTGRKIIVDTYGGMPTTAGAHSPEKTPQKWIEPRPTPDATWQKTS